MDIVIAFSGALLTKIHSGREKDRPDSTGSGQRSGRTTPFMHTRQYGIYVYIYS